MQQKVVIIGHSFSSRLSITRSVAQIGCDVTVIVMTGYKRDGKTLNTSKPIDCYSKYVSHVYYCHRRDSKGLMRLLLEKCTDDSQRVILFPDSDDSVVTIDKHKDELKEHFMFPHICNGSGSTEYWMNKLHQKETARSVGLSVAEGVVIDIQDGKYDIPSSIQYPCYTKPLATMNGGKGGMHRCNNVTELCKALNEFITTRMRTGKVLAEQYKEIETEYALLGFSDGKEVVIPGIMQLLVISKKNKGIALQGNVMPGIGFEDVIAKFKQLVLEIGFVGIFDIDFFSSKGTFYFCELNLRYGGSGYAYTKMGANLPALMVSFFNNDIAKGISEEVQGGNVFINEKMCYEDWNYGYLSTKEFLNIVSTQAIHFVYDEKDPIPGLIFRLMFYRTFLLKKLRSVIRMLSHDK